MRSYRPEELFDDDGRLRPSWPRSRPTGDRRMSANPHANGGVLLRAADAARLPRLRRRRRGARCARARRPRGARQVPARRDQREPDNFRLFGPDETASNRLGAVLRGDRRAWMAERLPDDDHLAPDGRVMEVLSEHLCQGWLEGYLLTGRHGLFNCYEAFIHIVDSMFNQHAKWLKVTRQIPWRRADRLAQLSAELPRLAAGPQRLLPPGPRLPRPRGQQEGRDHPGVSAAGHQHAALGRRPLPAQPRLRQRHRRGQAARAEWLSMDEAIAHCTRGIGIWEWASNDEGAEPDVVLACCGRHPDPRDAGRGRPAPPAPARRLGPGRQRRRPDAAAADTEHPHGLPDGEFDALFTTDQPDHVRVSRLPVARSTASPTGGRTTATSTSAATRRRAPRRRRSTWSMLNDLDRFHLVMDVIDRVPGLAVRSASLRQRMVDARLAARLHTREYGEDPPEIRDWTWPGVAHAEVGD